MAKASPARRNFNAGEFSILVEGRTDIEKYGASMRTMRNCVAAPQGPCLGRSGTYFIAEVHDHAKYSTLVGFNNSDTDTLQLEFSDQRIAFHFETGVQTYAPVLVTAVVSLVPFVITSAALVAGGAAVNSRIALNSFPNSWNLNGRFFKIAVIVGNNITLDLSVAAPITVGAISALGALKYTIASPYSDVDARNIRPLQDQDTLYLFCKGYQPRKLSRLGPENWVLSLKPFDEGPFMNEATFGRVSLAASGSQFTASSGTATGGTNPGNAMTDDLLTYWDSGSPQGGIWTFQYTSGSAVATGYVIYPHAINADPAFSAKDFAPGTWTFEGSNDGITWTILDTQKEYVLYDSRRSVYFQIKNTLSFSRYRFNVTQCVRNGNINVRVARFDITTTVPTILTVTLSGTYTDFNGGAGFKATDVGRLIRIRSQDNYYRIMKVTSFTSSTIVVALMLGEPFLGPTTTTQWSPSYFSDTTGWPAFGCFFEDRLWVAGVVAFPGLVSGSRTGLYDNFATKTALDEVLDDSAIVAIIKSRKVSDVRWLNTDERGLLLGTGTGEFVITAANPDNALTARNVKGRASTERGSAFIEPAKVDRQILHVHVSRRSVREYTYSFQSDGYVSRSLSLFASHLGVPKLAQMVYAAEPHSILWYRRDDGSVVGLTYNKEEDVIGWHQHDFSGIVESMSVIPSAVDIQDSLWIVIRRTIGASQKRYIEKLTRFWDFDSTVENAHYVDSGLKYVGLPTNVLFGLSHLEGKLLTGVLNGIPYDGMLVTNGKIDPLPIEDVTIAVVGLPYEQFGEIANIEAGAADGTAQGKVGRVHNVSVHLWQTYYGEVGKFDQERQEYVWDDIEYRERFDELEPITLQTEILKPMNLPPGYGNRKSLAFRQTRPLPLNIIALYPQMNTQDR